MYVHAIDPLNAVLLGIYSGRKAPEDIEQYAQSQTRVDAIAYEQGRGALMVFVPDPEYPAPNSSDRLRFATLKDASRAAPNLVVLVTRSPLLRGVITAVGWLSPQNERSRATACDSFEATLEHAAKFRSSSVDSLRRMERMLRARLARTQAA
jgi:hypothetical protein